MPTSYSPVTTTSAVASWSPRLMRTWRRTLPLPCRRGVSGVSGCSSGAPGAIAALGVGQRLEHAVLDDDRVGRAARGLGVVGGDDRDRLALVAHVVDREHRLVGDLHAVDLAPGDVVVGEHGVDAGDGQRRADVDAPDVRARVRAAQRGAVQHPLHAHVRGVLELALDLRDAVGAGGRDPDLVGALDLAALADRGLGDDGHAAASTRSSRRRLWRAMSRAISSTSPVRSSALSTIGAPADEQQVDRARRAEDERRDGILDPGVVEAVQAPQRDVGQLADLQRAQLVVAAQAARALDGGQRERAAGGHRGRAAGQARVRAAPRAARRPARRPRWTRRRRPRGRRARRRA